MILYWMYHHHQTFETILCLQRPFVPRENHARILNEPDKRQFQRLFQTVIIFVSFIIECYFLKKTLDIASVNVLKTAYFQIIIYHLFMTIYVLMLIFNIIGNIYLKFERVS